MPLNVTPKAGSVNSNTPSRVVTRQEAKIAQPTASTSRAEALKARLTGKAPSNPVTPRPTGSSARREEIGKLQKFTAPQSVTQPKLPPNAARREPQDLSSIEPPPSGNTKQEMVQTPNNVETVKPTVEATNEALTGQFATLARQERQIRKARQELKAAQDAWKQEQANYIPKQQLTSDTLKVLAEAGITSDKLVELQLSQAAPPDPNQILLNEIAELKKQLQGITDPENGTLAQRDKQQYDQAISQIRSDTKLLVDSNPAYGTIKSEGKTEDVVELITSVFNEEGIVLDVEEASQLVEDKLVERLYKQYERISQYEKIKARLGKQSENTAEAIPEQGTVKQTQDTTRVTTLTNAGASMRPQSARDRAIAIVQAALDARKGK